MKGISSLMSNAPKRVNEAVAGSAVNNSEETRRNVEAILNGQSVPMPEVVVDDNPKAKKYADIIISQLNKRCGWSTYHLEEFVDIMGRKSILFLNNSTKQAVGFTPTGNDTNATFYYFGSYNFYGDKKNEVVLIVDGGEFGIIQALSIIVDCIKNPSLYKVQITEALGYGDVEAKYRGSIDGKFFSEFERFINGDEKGHQIRNMTPEGVKALAERIRETKADPVEVLKAILNDTPEGFEYRKLLGDPVDNDGRKTKRLAPERYIVALKYICKLIGGDITTSSSVAVTESKPAKLGDWEYNGVNVNFLKRCGIDYDLFVKVANDYQATLDSMEGLLRDFIKYTRASRVDKLTNPEFRGMTPALFISGIGGIGKSNTWKKVKKDADLNVRRGFDYAERGSAPVLPQEVYKFIYDNNGKLLVFDDTPDLFSSSYAPSFWKAALTMPDESEFSIVQAPNRTGGAYYSLSDCKIGNIVSAKMRYEKECPIERKSFPAGMSAEEKAKLEAESKTIYTPNEIPVMSKFLFIVNESEDDMAKQLGAHWGAIKSRVRFMVIAPPAEVLWTKIKSMILATQDDEAKAWIPKPYVKEVIDFVEDLLYKQAAENLSFRGFGDGGIRYAITHGDDWKLMLKGQLGETSLERINLRG